ncbi:exo-beta-N-acetylmuramidase NamZ family protein [Cohnella sp. 56]|uniref:exo-beta-N-acetylmuramidase NamZ family protein n=1 Tax=Cohnella sp. 56 TaxID=3113722 RepID=UPI0030EAF163
MATVLNGVDTLASGKYDGLLQGKRLGLITAPTGLTLGFESTIQRLHDRYRLAALFSPEHGVRGDQPAGGSVDTYTDERTGVPVYSLYRKDSKRLTPEMLEQVDAVVYDIQDVGVRYYTFIYTMLYALEDCAKAGKPFIVLDRIAPLDGVTVEGNVLKDGYRSFVGGYPLAVRYGLTAGEVATMANAQQGWGAELHVVRCEGWERELLYPDTGRLWIHPSLGIPRFETALLYGGTCLFEGTNLSEGRGTTFPFEMIGAPFVDAERLSDEMNGLGLPGVRFRPAYFKPSFSKHEGELCRGVQLHVTDARAVRPLDTGVFLLQTIKRNYEAFAFLPTLREGSRPFIDLLGGDTVYRDEGWDAPALLARFREESAAFAAMKAEFHLY